MKMQDIVYDALTKNGEMRAEEVAEIEGVSDRTYASKLLSKLVEEGRVTSRRDGRNIFYAVSNYQVILEKDVRLRGLREEEIWSIAHKSELFPSKISEEAETIFEFAFTEMLNNAIDHSKSGSGYIKLWTGNDSLKFIIRDYGIGIFKNVMSKKKLHSETEALQEILKGKLTTDPLKHSGEGVFWTTKIADRVNFTSYKLKLSIDNLSDDYSIENLDESLLGTEVYFEVSKSSKKSMSALFHKYSFDENKIMLDTTSIPIKLYDAGETWISRSQAKKILSGLEKFKRITFDFSGIKLIGQGFADEIFRVFQIAHPDIVLESKNANKSVQFMIDHAKNDPTGKS